MMMPDSGSHLVVEINGILYIVPGFRWMAEKCWEIVAYPIGVVPKDGLSGPLWSSSKFAVSNDSCIGNLF